MTETKHGVDESFNDRLNILELLFSELMMGSFLLLGWLSG